MNKSKVVQSGIIEKTMHGGIASVENIEQIAKRNLPPGYTVRTNPAVGFDFIDERGRPVVQLPLDNNSMRAFVWDIYYRKLDEKKQV